MHKYHLNNYYWGQKKQIEDVTLIQIGVMHCNAGDVIPLHVQGNYYEITAVIDGEGYVRANGENQKVERGFVHLVGPFDSHEIQSSVENPLKYLFFLRLS